MKKELGQYFTPEFIVQKMISLIDLKNPKILEPCSGNGSFYKHLIKKFKNVKAIEIDKQIAHKEAIIKDFFDEKDFFDVVIGNPPYVEYKKMNKKFLRQINNKKFIHKPNLYMFFIERALKLLKKNGLLIFIIPMNWTTNFSSNLLVKEIYLNYSIEYYEIIKENVWQNANITTVIFKIRKRQNSLKKLNYFLTKNNKLLFGSQLKKELNNKIISIKVGAASGNNKFFANEQGDTEFIFSKTNENFQLKKMNYLNNLNKWIRKLPLPPNNFSYQIFVNTVTRKLKPFFWLENQKKNNLFHYDASILCLYTNFTKKEVPVQVEYLNKINWKDMGIYRNGRFHFTQSLLLGIFK